MAAASHTAPAKDWAWPGEPLIPVSEARSFPLGYLSVRHLLAPWPVFFMIERVLGPECALFPQDFEELSGKRPGCKKDNLCLYATCHTSLDKAGLHPRGSKNPLAGVMGKGWRSRKLGTGSNRSHYPQGEQMGSLDQGDGLREGHTKSGLEVRGLCIREWLEAKRYKQGQESGERAQAETTRDVSGPALWCPRVSVSAVEPGLCAGEGQWSW